MKRVYILCEGQTEETFVNAVLSPYFTPQDIYVILAVIPEYRKVADGSDLSQAIGIDRMIASCPHFAAWIQKMRE